MTAELPGIDELVTGPARRGVTTKFLRDPMALIGLGIIALLLGIVVIGWIRPFDPNGVRLELTNAPPFTTDYLLGGDKYGRDILSRLVAGTASAFGGMVATTVVAVVLGVSSGLLAGYFGGVLDGVGSWVTSIIIAVPGMVVLIALYTMVGTSMFVAMLALGVLVSPNFFWLTRALTRGVRQELYVDAARVSGLSNARIVGRHVLLAVRAPIIVQASFLAGTALGIQAGLEFIGLADPSIPSWGGMLTDAFNNIYIADWQLVWPGLALGLTMAAFVLVGNALRDALQGTHLKTSRRAQERRRRRVTAGTDRDELPGEMDAAVPSAVGPELLRVRNLQIGYENSGTLSTVVDGVSFDVSPGEIVGLVGESGSGKSQTVFAALGLLPDEAIILGGSIRMQGVELLDGDGRSNRRLGALMGYVPQEPMSNLDPSFTVGSQLVYGIRAQSGGTRADARKLALSMLKRVGINNPERTFRAYPHEVSGGMAQRVLIAGAVACQPPLLVADEPTTALDVTVQAEVLDLLRDLQAERQTGTLIVTHDLGVVADLCDRVVVMKDGRVVEQGRVDEVFRSPHHEYTRALLSDALDGTTANGAKS